MLHINVRERTEYRRPPVVPTDLRHLRLHGGKSCSPPGIVYPARQHEWRQKRNLVVPYTEYQKKIFMTAEPVIEKLLPAEKVIKNLVGYGRRAVTIHQRK